MTLPRSPAQSAASRANGALSHSPATPEGRARSSLNGTTRGLTTRTFALLPGEDPAEHAALLDGYLVRHAPADEAERFWVERAVAAAWRLRRLEALETRAFAAADAPAASDPRLPSLATLARYRARIDRDLRAALAELDRLSAARPRLPRRHLFANPEPGRLRWIADRMEEQDAARASRAGGGDGGIGEPEPAAFPAGPPSAPEEETHAAAPVSASEPAAPEPPAPNRAQRRRHAALLRRGRLAA